VIEVSFLNAWLGPSRKPRHAVNPMPYYVHPSSVIDPPVQIGDGTRIWHFCHVMQYAVIGPECSLGQNVFVASGVRVGRGVKIQNNVSLYEGVVLDDYVFCGPSCVFTNVVNPRSEIVRRTDYRSTHVGRGATIGANATIVCETRIGRYAFIAAGAVVTKGDIPQYGLMAGVPARRIGWMSRHGQRLARGESDGLYRCPQSGWRYQEQENGALRCLDRDEDAPLVGQS
jgi:UDP-2-acetamido-3-amino-2,3-dideoxy-glucuronate N-acetyltransferase